MQILIKFSKSLKVAFLATSCLFIIAACNNIGTAEFKTAAEGTGSSSESSTLTFSGISSVDQVSDTTARLNWSNHAAAVGYEVYNLSSGSPIFVSFITAPASDITITGLSVSTAYSYRVKAKDAYGILDSNTNDQEFTTNAAPDVPSGVTMLNPSGATGINQTPTIRVNGVKSGDTVSLFTDSSCSNQVGSVVSTGTSVDITTSTLAAGSYSFYANATGTNTSACSTETAAYALSPCSSDWIEVPGNSLLGTSDFCVMKYEAKNVGGIATSQAASTPWVSINQTDSSTACRALGVNYDLISNPEWMTIAYSIEETDSNWSNGDGTGMLNRGHSDNSSTALAVTDINDDYDGTGNNSGQAPGSGWEQKRTHTLSNGEVIWDFAGNVRQWVDWTTGGSLTGVTPANKAYYSTDGAPQSTWIQFTTLDTNINNGDEMETLAWQPLDSSLNSSNGIGLYYAGDNLSGGAALRGGNWNNNTHSGVFALALNASASFTGSYIGFRCVFRP